MYICIQTMGPGHSSWLHIRMYVYSCIYIYIHISTCIYVYTQSMSPGHSAWLHTRMYVYVYINKYIHIHTVAAIYSHIQALYIYMSTQSRRVYVGPYICVRLGRHVCIQPDIESVAAIYRVCCSHVYMALHIHVYVVMRYASRFFAAIYRACCSHTQSLLQPYVEPVAAMYTWLAVYTCLSSHEPYIEPIAAIHRACCSHIQSPLHIAARYRAHCSHIQSLLQPFIYGSIYTCLPSHALCEHICCSHIQSLLQPDIESVAAIYRACCSHMWNLLQPPIYGSIYTCLPSHALCLRAQEAAAHLHKKPPHICTRSRRTFAQEAAAHLQLNTYGPTNTGRHCCSVLQCVAVCCSVLQAATCVTLNTYGPTNTCLLFLHINVYLFYI